MGPVNNISTIVSNYGELMKSLRRGEVHVFQSSTFTETSIYGNPSSPPDPRSEPKYSLHWHYPWGKTDAAKADKRGRLGGRKALNDISNSRKPSGLKSVKKDNSTNVISIEKDPCAVKSKLSKAHEKGKVCGRKALGDLTNSVKPPSKQVHGGTRKSKALEGSNVPSCITEEGFLHNHQGCIAAQMKTVDMNYFLKSVGLNNVSDAAIESSARMARRLSSNKHESNMKHLDMEEIPEHLFEDRLHCKKYELVGADWSPACRSPPQSPKAPFMSWADDNFSDLKVIESPKLV